VRGKCLAVGGAKAISGVKTGLHGLRVFVCAWKLYVNYESVILRVETLIVAGWADSCQCSGYY
jgi:hypothetical protein